LEKSIESILKKREPIYKLADVTIETSNKNKSTIISEIKKNL
jgi:shikimate kinase